MSSSLKRRIVSLAVIPLGMLGQFTQRASAGVTAVVAPNLLRPMDNVLYPFAVQVSGVYDHWAQVAVGVNYYAEYWDDDAIANDPIDLQPAPALIVPPGPAGAIPLVTPWGPIAHTFQVGCTLAGEVFGPWGATGENPMGHGMFRFDGIWNWWGYNSVSCIPAPIPAPPTPPPGWNGVPIPRAPVPEPGSIGLMLVGLIALAFRRR